MRKPKIVENKAKCDAATERLEELMAQDDPSVEEADELKLLAVLVERYEEERFPIDFPSPPDEQSEHRLLAD